MIGGNRIHHFTNSENFSWKIKEVGEENENR